LCALLTWWFEAEFFKASASVFSIPARAAFRALLTANAKTSKHGKDCEQEEDAGRYLPAQVKANCQQHDG
jgi:hypothetical protein